MTHVWSVWESDPESASLVGLFLSRESAEAKARMHAGNENTKTLEVYEDHDGPIPLWYEVREESVSPVGLQWCVLYRQTGGDESYSIEVSQMEVQP